MKKEKEILSLLEKAARIKVEQRNSIWPPPCVGIFHQPKRPVSHKEK